MKTIDRKYSAICTDAGAVHGVGIFKNNGDQVPDDEPLILFRARDRIALPMLAAYRRLCLDDNVTQFQIDALDLVIADFQKFATDYPDRMKQPGITLGK